MVKSSVLEIMNWQLPSRADQEEEGNLSVSPIRRPRSVSKITQKVGRLLFKSTFFDFKSKVLCFIP